MLRRTLRSPPEQRTLDMSNRRPKPTSTAGLFCDQGERTAGSDSLAQVSVDWPCVEERGKSSLPPEAAELDAFDEVLLTEEEDGENGQCGEGGEGHHESELAAFV